MADNNIDSSATVHQLHPKKPLSGAERVRNYRERLRQKAGTAPAADAPLKSPDATRRAADVPAAVTPPGPVTAIVTHAVTRNDVTPKAYRVAPAILKIAACGLGSVGIGINGWFDQTLGSTDKAGWFFLAIGVTSHLAGLAIPTCASRQRWPVALAGWAVWFMTFIFAVTSGVGFASLNIANVTEARSLHVTPIVTMAQTALDDAKAARDRECKGGVGKFCREREAVVIERSAALNTARHNVEIAADPQTEAAIHIVSWLTLGNVNPTENDFAMLRLILLALLPQVGGILLMVAGRSAR